MSMINAYKAGGHELSPAEAEMIARREKLLGPAYRLFYEHPVHFVRGEGVWLYDAQGQAYLDAYNNVPSVGHCHPRVVEAIAKQAAQLNTHTRYLHRNILDYAERLLATMPAELEHAMFTCTGSEANDLAYRISLAHTGGTGFIVTQLAYHGCTKVIAELSPSLGNAAGRSPHVRYVPAPDAYRSFGEDVGEDVGAAFARHVAQAIEDMRKNGIRPAALIVDTLFTSDGVFADPPGFLSPAVETMRAAGGLFIADEVQAGFGRTGTHMWGFQRHGLVPDIVTMGKAMGAGYPIAGLAVQPHVIAEFAKTRYFNTFGGNPVSCAAGLAVLDVIEGEGLMENARQTGAYLKQELGALAKKHEVIGDIRGAGLFLGVELVKDRATKAQATEATGSVVNALRERRVLLSASGPHANILKIRPPLPFSKENADFLVRELDAALGGL
ncbi:MAG: aminotransferase class III-fold pyridoxal phosphate-dependent enzyme [Alphaproteobacteria bacterium]|nr:aminotransferase class III-fold pyridoxal phosphate-dependent enzyme [Alphaproteobacteria bacterium]